MLFLIETDIKNNILFVKAIGNKCTEINVHTHTHSIVFLHSWSKIVKT